MDALSGCTPAFLFKYCSRQGFSLDKSKAQALSDYLNLLMQWNKVMNLVGAKHWRDALDELVMDSFHLEHFLQEQILMKLPAAPEIWDLGAGAGLPGIPLRILWQDGTYWLVEAREKRAIFLSTVLARQTLPGTRVFRGRAEVFMRDKKADLIVSRAFMPWRELLEFVHGVLRPGGVVVFLSLEEFHTPPGTDWLKVGHYVYETGKETRHFCAFSAV